MPGWGGGVVMPGWVDGGCLLNSDFSVPSHASINCPLAQTELASRATRAVTSVLRHNEKSLFASNSLVAPPLYSHPSKFKRHVI